MNKSRGYCLIQEHNGYKVVNQYIELIIFGKLIELKLNYVVNNGNTQKRAIQQYIRKDKE